jgi:hypothetical protein
MMEAIIHNLFSIEAGVVWLVLKWMLVVLAAGFIGQFGKALATYLMRRTPQGKETSPQDPPETLAGATGPERTALQEKPFTAQPSAEPPIRLKDEKKQKKAQAKQQKKLLKKLFH